MGNSFQHQVKSILSRTNIIKTQKVQSYILLLPQKMSPFMFNVCLLIRVTKGLSIYKIGSEKKLNRKIESFIGVTLSLFKIVAFFKKEKLHGCLLAERRVKGWRTLF